jgi:hypothetical protein
MSVVSSIVDYSGRQVDVELLQTVTRPLGTVPVTLSNITTTPKIVTGVQKALQRYTTILCTALGDIHFDTLQGTDLLTSVSSGAITNNGVLLYVFALATRDTLRQMALDDADTDTFGAIPDDERIDSAELTDYSMDYTNATLSLTIQFTMVSGSAIVYVIPVSTAR